MIKFVLISGVFINPFFISSLVPNKSGCTVFVGFSTRTSNSSVWEYDDNRPCEEIIKLINQ